MKYRKKNKRVCKDWADLSSIIMVGVSSCNLRPLRWPYPVLGHGNLVCFCWYPSKIRSLCPSAGITSKSSTRAPFLGTCTGLNRILSVPALFPLVNKTNREHDFSWGTKESEQRPLQCLGAVPWYGHLNCLNRALGF